MYVLTYETAFVVRRHLIRLWNALMKSGVKKGEIRHVMLKKTGLAEKRNYFKIKAKPYPKLDYIVYIMFEHYIKKGPFVLEYPKGEKMVVTKGDFKEFKRMLTYNPTKQ